MKKAISLAKHAERAGDVPIGACIIYNSKIIVASGNRIIRDNDPTAHAEIIVLRKAAKKLGTARLVNCDLYVTLEPCPMCAQAISFSFVLKIRYLRFGLI